MIKKMLKKKKINEDVTIFVYMQSDQVHLEYKAI